MTAEKITKENKMGTMKINKLLITMSLPMILSMLIQALYNIVDSYFVNQINQEAFNAVSLAFPIQHLMIGVATGTAVGVNALLSKSLGEKDTERANRIAENGVFLALMSYIVFLLFGLFGTKLFYGLYRSEVSAATIEYGISYLSICTIFSFGIFGQIIFERLMQATGRTIYTMLTQGIGAIINIILDPILIFGRYGFPEMGVEGAAAATVIGQIIAFALAFFINRYKNKDISLSLFKFRPDGAVIKRIYAIGVPSIIMMAIGSFMNIGINKILGQFKTETPITVFGVYFKLQSFIFMPVLGLNNGLIPIVAFNYGAKSRKRLMKTIKIALIYAVGFMSLGLLLLQLFPEFLLGIFETDKIAADFYDIGIPAFRILSLSFLFAGFCIVICSAFQALGRGMLSLIVSFARQIIVLLPAAYLLALSGSIDLVWWSFPIAEIASVTVSALCFFYLWRKLIRYIPANA